MTNGPHLHATMPADLTYTRNPEFPVRIVDDELIALDVTSTRCFVLDAVGRRIWELLEAPRSVAQLCAALRKEYEADPATMAADVGAFLDELVTRGVVVAGDAGQVRE